MVGELKIDNVHKRFKNTDPYKDDVIALGGLSLDIKPGSFVSLIGPSGCGKSTLLRIIGGLDKSTEGHVYIDGNDIKKPGSDRGFAFQGSNLFPWLTVEKNIAFGLKARGIYKDHQKDVDEAIYMSDQVVVMSARPSKVEEIIDIDLPRPRARAQDTFGVYRTKILDVLNLGGKIDEIEYYL